MSGIELIAEERRRQVDELGWSARHDRSHGQQELARAAAVYALPEEVRRAILAYWGQQIWPRGWTLRRNDTRLRELVRAGALIAAEIDRLQAAHKPESVAS